MTLQQTPVWLGCDLNVRSGALLGVQNIWGLSSAESVVSVTLKKVI